MCTIHACHLPHPTASGSRMGNLNPSRAGNYDLVLNQVKGVLKLLINRYG